MLNMFRMMLNSNGLIVILTQDRCSFRRLLRFIANNIADWVTQFC